MTQAIIEQISSNYVDEYQAEAKRLAQTGMYDPTDEKDACGVGFVADMNGKPSRKIVDAALGALAALGHRGAVDADGKTGDGAGIHIQIPQEFFADYLERIRQTPAEDSQGENIAVGMIFLPRTDLDAQERCRCIVESEILNYGYRIYGWRQVPVNVQVCGDKANASRPEIEQILIEHPSRVSDEQFDNHLYIIRRRIEKRVSEAGINDFYICSLSCRSVIYKGMFLAQQCAAFYPDLSDPHFVSNFAIYHQRYSTNTFPTWKLAQPFRILAHNGEINTLKGNINWNACHEPRMAAPVFGEAINDILPVIQPGGSDSAVLDNVAELIVRAGRPLPMVKVMCLPEAWRHDDPNLPEAHRHLYSYGNAIMEPWDGPAAICGTDGTWVLAGMDRNGLRPLRYVITHDGMMVAGSEIGLVPMDEALIVEKGRLGPGQMIAVNLEEGRLYKDHEVKDRMARRQDFAAWSQHIFSLDVRASHQAAIDPPSFDGNAASKPGRKTKSPESQLSDAELRKKLMKKQLAVGWTMEEVELVLQPMVDDAKEPVGSMGDDAPLAVLSERYRGLHSFFRQNFSQVTNPPIDSLRERRVMSLRTRLGNLGNILEEDESQCHLIQLESPILTDQEFAHMRHYLGKDVAEIDCTFAVSDAPGHAPGQGHKHGHHQGHKQGHHQGHEKSGETLRDALKRVQREAEEAIRGGKKHLVLSDKHEDEGRIALPMILVAGGVHSHLVRQSLRTFTSLNIRSAECLDVHYCAVLIGVGATTVNPWLAEATIADRHRRGLCGSRPLHDCLQRYKLALNEGLLKIMSKMGISVLSSYRGGCNFEAIGLSRTLVADFFPGMTSRISGIGLIGIENKLRELHGQAYQNDTVLLPVGGMYRYRHGGERHAWEANLIHQLQVAVTEDNYALFRQYSAGLQAGAPVHLRDLLEFVPTEESGRKAIAVEEVESITQLRKRFNTPAMSLGALSPEAHRTLGIAMNRMGARSDSGEGGEDPACFKPLANGDNANSAIKQIASGRFGVTTDYLVNCSEIEIKVAQGAKPGEGGQLPAFKVTEMIAKLRHSTPGVSLISPPPHHDIYSIEDLAQLIYDLKQVNSAAKVCVKLVARSGIGTIAAGVAKAKADVILVSGHVGGTGASPLSSIKFAGTPWEMGLSEVHQVLTLNRMRHRVKLRVDGGIKTGRDVVMAAMLGAEEFGVGTASLVAMGCIMVRQCHSNTCPVGICTQDPKMREKFGGSPDKVVNLFSFIAEEVREILASLGARSLEEIIGRTDLLKQVSRGHKDLDDLDLNPLLTRADDGGFPTHGGGMVGRNEVADTLDAQMLKDAANLFTGGEKKQLAYSIRNTYRTIGTRLSSEITKHFGMKTLPPDHITVQLRGSAGQSLGAFLVQGVTLEVYGDANDYVGKGLSGGLIIVRPPKASNLPSHLNTIIGNTVLYGATAGQLFAAGQAGERFAVRNSGADVVVEGCGSNGCEYMTGGTAVILGAVGDNFAAGMTGGMAFVYDSDENFMTRLNGETVVAERVTVDYWQAKLRSLVERHVDMTDSKFAGMLLAHWEEESRKFWQIVPREMLSRLPVPIMIMPSVVAAE
ncbi:MAG: glutamate synthase large subunit [Candidatus Symbiobacter sp.]|nr:glutamate synthase large subunit [Candidatus Symbiobacter sp.]